MFRYSEGKTPLIIIAIFNAQHDCHCVSDLAPSKMEFQASPRGGAEADFEAQIGTLVLSKV